MWISCAHFFWPPASCRRLEEALEDLAGEDRAARDESGEVADRVRALPEQLERLVGRVHTARRDDLELGAEAPAGSAEVRERSGEDFGPGEAAGPLRQARLLHATGVAVVHNADP